MLSKICFGKNFESERHIDIILSFGFVIFTMTKPYERGAHKICSNVSFVYVRIRYSTYKHE